MLRVIAVVIDALLMLFVVAAVIDALLMVVACCYSGWRRGTQRSGVMRTSSSTDQ